MNPRYQILKTGGVQEFPEANNARWLTYVGHAPMPMEQSGTDAVAIVKATQYLVRRSYAVSSTIVGGW